MEERKRRTNEGKRDNQNTQLCGGRFTLDSK